MIGTGLTLLEPAKEIALDSVQTVRLKRKPTRLDDYFY